jgi:hypothetical protein
MTKEHIWSDWLKNELDQPPYTRQIIFSDFDSPGRATIEENKSIPSRMNQRKVRKVCTNCNNGWMGRIVNGSKPFATTMIRGYETILNEQSQTELAAWIALSTIMAEYTVPSHRMAITGDERKYVMDNLAPPTAWTIRIGKYKGRAWRPIVHYHCAWGMQDDSPGPSADRIARIQKCQVTTYSLNFLIIQVFSVDDGDMSFIERFRAFPVPLAMVQIWPLQSQIVKWPHFGAVGDAELRGLSVGFRDSLR